MSKDNTAAGIVAFYPDPHELTQLARTVGAEVGRVYIFCNSPLAPSLRSTLEQSADVTLIDGDGNRGIGAGLNGAVEAALQAGFTGMVLFDQDSHPEPGTITHLRAVQAALQAAGRKPAAVAPKLVVAADRRATSKPPTYRYRSDPPFGQARAVEFVPTSGSLLDLTAWRDIGPFRADWFIDCIDLEWCFRAWARGWSCWVATDRSMVHSVGDGVIAWPIVGFAMPEQRPFRMYCAVRNTVYGLRLKHMPLGWRARQVAYLPVQMAAYALHHRFRPAILGHLARGVRDGLAGRLGTPPAAPDGRAAQDRHEA